MKIFLALHPQQPWLGSSACWRWTNERQFSHVTNWEFKHCPLVVQAFIALFHHHYHHQQQQQHPHHQVLLFMLQLHLNSSTTDGLISGFLAPMCLKTDRRTGMVRPPAVLFFSSMKVQMVWNFAEWISSKSSSMRNGWGRGGGYTPPLSISHINKTWFKQPLGSINLTDILQADWLTPRVYLRLFYTTWISKAEIDSWRILYGELWSLNMGIWKMFLHFPCRLR